MAFDCLDEAIQKIDLLDYASQSFHFKRAGMDTYKCSCPLHSDPNPSLSITPSKNLFYCFSCGAGGTIVNWLMAIEHLSFRQAVDKVSELSGMDINDVETSSAMEYYKLMAPKEDNQKTERVILPEKIMDTFSDELPDEWVCEGITPEVLKKYGVRIDKRGNRIVYPVWDSSGQLIGVKGRTRFKNYQELKISKYMNYYKIGTVDYFMGLKENRAIIEQSRRAIIFEGIKSGMKVEGWGYSNWLSAETAWLNDYQIKLLVQMKLKEVIIAFDKDVKLDKLRKCVERLKWFTSVSAVYDRWNLLGEKDSPCDKGAETWEELLKKRIKL